MRVDGKDIRTIWLAEDESIVKIIDQRKLPHEFIIVDLQTVDDAIEAIKNMLVRGAPLIGATGAYGMYLATLNAPNDQNDNEYLKKEGDRLRSARPTAVNLAWAVDKVLTTIVNESDPAEIKYVYGLDQNRTTTVLICPPTSPAANFAFDVTPAKYVTGFRTERGICKATEADIRRLFPEK